MPQFRPSCKGHNHLISRGKDSGGMEKNSINRGGGAVQKVGEGGRRLGVGMNGGGGRCV